MKQSRKMSSSSDSEEFFDAEDITPSRNVSKEGASIVRRTGSEPILGQDDAEKGTRREEGRQRFRELRQRMQTDDEEGAPANASPPDSQTSSVEGVCVTSSSGGAPGRATHPFRIIEHDALSLQSLSSLGRVGRLLGAVREAQASLSTLSTSSKDSESPPAPPVPAPAPPIAAPVADSLQEPDVVASAKGAAATQPEAPVAPPRRKKKNRGGEGGALASPASTIESLTREFEHSLDIREATRGQYVVKPQDEATARAQGPPPLELERLRSQLLSEEGPRPKYRGSGNGSSLGPHRGAARSARERRRSAGDESMIRQLNMLVRTRTDSGKQLTDLEILEQVTVLNLDTGERVPLSVAEEKIPRCINPLSLQIMRLTSEYVSRTGGAAEGEEAPRGHPADDDDSVAGGSEGGRARSRAARLRRFLGTTVRHAVDKARSMARPRDEPLDGALDDGDQVKLRASHSHRGPSELEHVQQAQELVGEHVGPVWCMKFSGCGRLLATAGQDKVLRVWAARDALPFFHDMRARYNADKASPTPSQESLASLPAAAAEPADTTGAVFGARPFCTYTGHTSDLLDVAWSKNYFLLSSSMDKTVRLWHITRRECLCCFQHIDFVTAIAFHPRDDRYFLSGSLDGKLRLWNIPDKKVAVWNEVEGQTKLITAANFCQQGKFAVVGTYDGRCIFYITDQLKYHTQIHVRSARGRNATPRKISGLEPMPGEDKLLVTSNDSRVRLYDLCDLSLSCKYKGLVNASSQIRASFSPDGKYIVAGSENRDVYVWKTHHDYAKFSSVRRDRNDFWEAIKAHAAVVTCAIFSPNPQALIRMWEESGGGGTTDKVDDPVVEQRTRGCGGHVLVSADFNGCIKVFVNRTKPKHSSLPASALV